MSVMTAGAGAYVHLFTDLLRGGGFMFALLSLGLAVGLHMTPDNGKNRLQRLGMLLGFAFISGLGMGPLLDMAIRINPAIIANALTLATGIFVAFSCAALVARDGQYLFLGGVLFSAMTTMFWMGLANLFFQSQLIFQVVIIFNFILKTILMVAFIDFCLGSHVDWTSRLLRIRFVGHSDDHPQEKTWRRRLCRSHFGSFH